VRRASALCAAIHQEALVALERLDACFERRNFCVELLDQLLPRILPISEKKDATEGWRDEDVVFLWDDRQVRRDYSSPEGPTSARDGRGSACKLYIVKATTDGEWGTTCGACRLVRIVGSAGVHFHTRMTSKVA
jgi:hypothetical protein